MNLTDLQSLPVWQLVAAGIFVGSLVVQLFYYLFFFLRLALYKPVEDNSRPQPVSVIICAWNEEENLKKNLLLDRNNSII